MSDTGKPKIIMVVGPTASGKTSLAIELAQHFNGEVISADSRQVYTGLDIGSGKITKREMRGVPHHLLDVSSPQKVFTVAQYKERADAAIADIISRGKLPIICGGTGFYIDAVVSGVVLPDVPPNKQLRTQLEKKSAAHLFKMLQKLDPKRAQNIDPQNPRRIIRAIEIVRELGEVPHISKKSPYQALFIGTNVDPDILREKIARRLKTRLKKGMIDEARRLHRAGLSWKRMESLGLEYKYLALFLQKKISRAEMENLLTIAINQYARRQMMWFKRNKKIEWMKPKDLKKIEKKVLAFL